MATLELPEDPLIESPLYITCVYFKDSGKYYTDGCEMYELDDPMFKGCVYPRQYGKALNKAKKLPGLSSGTWRQCFTVTVNNNYPELVMPLEMNFPS